MRGEVGGGELGGWWRWQGGRWRAPTSECLASGRGRRGLAGRRGRAGDRADSSAGKALAWDREGRGEGFGKGRGRSGVLCVSRGHYSPVGALGVRAGAQHGLPAKTHQRPANGRRSPSRAAGGDRPDSALRQASKSMLQRSDELFSPGACNGGSQRPLYGGAGNRLPLPPGRVL